MFTYQRRRRVRMRDELRKKGREREF